jgi:hypothetical protein
MSVLPSPAAIPERQAVTQRSASSFPAPADLRVEPSAWSMFVTTQLDALIIGEGIAVSRVLTVMWPTVQKPVFWCEGGRLSLPASWERTLILENIDKLDIVDQQRLLDWLSSGVESPRLIATTAHQLVPLLDQGLFLRSLYNRLKGVEVIVT